MTKINNAPASWGGRPEKVNAYGDLSKVNPKMDRPLTTNSLAPIPKTQVLLVCQKDPPPRKLGLSPSDNSLCPYTAGAAAPLQSKLPVPAYSQSWQFCIPTVYTVGCKSTNIG